METTQKKGFFKSKLPKSFSRVLTKPSSGTDHHNMAKTSYSMFPMLSDRPTTGFHRHKVASYFKPPPSFYDQNGYGNERWGSGDENVDSMAASYISNVSLSGNVFSLVMGYSTTEAPPWLSFTDLMFQ